MMIEVLSLPTEKVMMCRNMWHSSESLHDFLAPATPNDTRFLFMSYAGTTSSSADRMEVLP